MRTKNKLAWVGMIGLALAMGCGGGPASNGAGASGGELDAVANSWTLTVDIDHASLNIGDAGGGSGEGVIGLNQFTQSGGHPVEVKNGPAGCAWEAATSTLTCEILMRNLDSDECMHHVRTRLYDSTNPSAILVGVDYLWPGPTIVPDTAQPINETGYCFTETSPDSGGPSEGCANTWQDNIPPGAIATQDFVFTNVPVGLYWVNLQIFADYQACSAPAGMALVPAGCFDMGDAFIEGGSDEVPAHNVCITSDFYLDGHEVTNVMYSACVSDGGCSAPSNFSSAMHASYYDNPTYDDFPVIYVSWDQATDYCAWAGKRLPTEAEWEYAARGGLAGKRYPWGGAISGAKANYLTSGDAWDNDASPAGNYGANYYGLYDMSGNVWEWVNDWYGAAYYSASPINDPSGPISGSSRVGRGGSWESPPEDLRTAIRSPIVPTSQSPALGFRCAGEAPPNLGAAADFVILGGSAITDTPFSPITGDVGLSPTTGAAITGLTCPEVTGTIYTIDAAGPACRVMDPARLTAVKVALTAAYDDVAARTVPVPVMVTGNLGGSTLPPGIYRSTSSLEISAGNLTLDAQGDPNAVWIFQIGSTLTTIGCGTSVPCATGGNVNLVNGADPANVFWQVGSSATIGDYTSFKGTIMAYVSISVNTGAQIQGRLLAGAQPSGAGAVTLIMDTVTRP